MSLFYITIRCIKHSTPPQQGCGGRAASTRGYTQTQQQTHRYHITKTPRHKDRDKQNTDTNTDAAADKETDTEAGTGIDTHTKHNTIPGVDVGELHVPSPQAALAVDTLGHSVEGDQLHGFREGPSHLSQHLRWPRSIAQNN